MRRWIRPHETWLGNHIVIVWDWAGVVMLVVLVLLFAAAAALLA